MASSEENPSGVNADLADPVVLTESTATTVARVASGLKRTAGIVLVGSESNVIAGVDPAAAGGGAGGVGPTGTTGATGKMRYGYDTPSVMFQLLMKSQPTKFAALLICAVVRPVPPALVANPEVAVFQ